MSALHHHRAQLGNMHLQIRLCGWRQHRTEVGFCVRFAETLLSAAPSFRASSTADASHSCCVEIADGDDGMDEAQKAAAEGDTQVWNEWRGVGPVGRFLYSFSVVQLVLYESHVETGFDNI